MVTLVFVIYVIGIPVAARLFVVWQKPHTFDYSDMRTPQQKRDSAAFVAVVSALIWPVLLGIALALSPFLALGWLISLPTRAERRQP